MAHGHRIDLFSHNIFPRFLFSVFLVVALFCCFIDDLGRGFGMKFYDSLLHNYGFT